MRGVSIALFLLCLSVFGTFMGASGINAALGVGGSTGLEGPTGQVQEDFVGEDQRPSERGGNTGILGFAVYAMKALGNFFVLFSSISSMFAALAGDRFLSLWRGIQLIVTVIGTLMLVWVARGVMGE